MKATKEMKAILKECCDEWYGGEHMITKARKKELMEVIKVIHGTELDDIIAMLNEPD